MLIGRTFMLVFFESLIHSSIQFWLVGEHASPHVSCTILCNKFISSRANCRINFINCLQMWCKSFSHSACHPGLDPGSIPYLKGFQITSFFVFLLAKRPMVYK